ncbi:MAG: hypothetical protein ACPGFC_12920 [Paracoccaceae bacterium]
MALPLAPIAFTVARYGAVAAVAFVAARNVKLSQTDQAVEDTLDTVEEGLSAHKLRDAPQTNVAARWRRVVRIGVDGPGVEIDASILGRIRLRRV